MQTVIYLAMSERYAHIYASWFRSHFNKYIINILKGTDILHWTEVLKKDDRVASEFCYIFCDSDDGLRALRSARLPVIAVSHPDNSNESLLAARWMVTGPEAVTSDYLAMIYARFHEIPLTVAQTPTLLLREFQYDDLTTLLKLQLENEKTPDGCFFRQGTAAVEEELESYIGNQYPFYDFGYYIIEIKEKDSPETAKALQNLNPHHLMKGYTEDALEEKYGIPVNPWAVGIAGFSLETVSGVPVLDFGYSVFKDWQRCGIATEAVVGLMGAAAFRVQNQNPGFWRSRLLQDIMEQYPITVRVHKNNMAGMAFARKMFDSPEVWRDPCLNIEPVICL